MLMTVLSFFFTIALKSLALSDAATIDILTTKQINGAENPRHQVEIPRARLLYHTLENGEGSLTVKFLAQQNIVLRNCQHKGKEAWTCPVSSFLYEVSGLELRDSYFVYYKGRQIGKLSLEVRDNTVVLESGISLIASGHTLMLVTF